MIFAPCFGIRMLVMFRLMFVHFTFSSVWVAVWPFLKIAARSVGHMFSLSFVYFYFFLFISHFACKSRIWLLIAPVPVHCFSTTFITFI